MCNLDSPRLAPCCSDAPAEINAAMCWPEEASGTVSSGPASWIQPTETKGLWAQAWVLTLKPNWDCLSMAPSAFRGGAKGGPALHVACLQRLQGMPLSSLSRILVVLERIGELEVGKAGYTSPGFC
ncbi:hypothetical protein Y1Q_0021179 [Alligator mississippiensis]|uniref:Uncharacterized protein n=1 Tax=Alligator mississippiensis TaxID=8496 RepID=A0A151N036_ALLMI|nr:hypothetical protein Y1Q_0021179 [Alligator mississippiensis]